MNLKKYAEYPGEVAHACNPSTLGGGDRRIRVRGQPQCACARTRSIDRSVSLLSLFLPVSHSLSLSLLSEVLRNFVRPGFKIKYEKIGPGV